MTDRALVTIDVAALGSGVPASTIRRWISEQRLTATTIQGSRPRYVRLGDVLELAGLRDTHGALPSASLPNRRP